MKKMISEELRVIESAITIRTQELINTKNKVREYQLKCQIRNLEEYRNQLMEVIEEDEYQNQ